MIPIIHKKQKMVPNLNKIMKKKIKSNSKTKKKWVDNRITPINTKIGIYYKKKKLKKNKIIQIKPRIRRFLNYRKFNRVKVINKLKYLFNKIIHYKFRSDKKQKKILQERIIKFKNRYIKKVRNKNKQKMVNNTNKKEHSFKKNNIKHIYKNNFVIVDELNSVYSSIKNKSSLTNIIFNSRPGRLISINGKKQIKTYYINFAKRRIRKKIRFTKNVNNILSSYYIQFHKINKATNLFTNINRFTKKYIKVMLLHKNENKHMDYMLLLDIYISRLLMNKKSLISLIKTKIVKNNKRIKQNKRKIIRLKDKKKKDILSNVKKIKTIINYGKKLRYFNKYSYIQYFINNKKNENKILKKKIRFKKFQFNNSKKKKYVEKRHLNRFINSYRKKKINWKEKIKLINKRKNIFSFFEKKFKYFFQKKYIHASFNLNCYKKFSYLLYNKLVKETKLFNALIQIKYLLPTQLNGIVNNNSSVMMVHLSDIKANDAELHTKWNNKIYKKNEFTPAIINDVKTLKLDMTNQYLHYLNKQVELFLYTDKFKQEAQKLFLLKHKIAALHNKMNKILLRFDFNNVIDADWKNIKNKYQQFLLEFHSLQANLITNINHKNEKQMYILYIHYKFKFIYLKKILHQYVHIINIAKNKFEINKRINSDRKHYNKILKNEKMKYLYAKVRGFRGFNIKQFNKKSSKKVTNYNYLLMIYKHIASSIINIIKNDKYSYVVVPYYHMSLYENIYRPEILNITLSEQHSNTRYLISDKQLILHSRSVGSLGFTKKDKRMKKWRKKLGEHMTYWTSKKLKKKKYHYIHIYTKGKRKMVKFLYYKLKYYLRKRNRKIRKMSKYKRHGIKYQRRGYYKTLKKIKNEINRTQIENAKRRNNIKQNKFKRYNTYKKQYNISKKKKIYIKKKSNTLKKRGILRILNKKNKSNKLYSKVIQFILKKKRKYIKHTRFNIGKHISIFIRKRKEKKSRRRIKHIKSNVPKIRRINIRTYNFGKRKMTSYEKEKQKFLKRLEKKKYKNLK